MARTEIDPQLPYIQVHRGVAAKAARLAQKLKLQHPNVTYQHVRGSLDTFWEGLADRRVLAAGLALPEAMVRLDDAECREQLALAFGMEIEPKLLASAGFLDLLPDGGWRVKGMSLYLNLERARLDKVRGPVPAGPGSHPAAVRGATPTPSEVPPPVPPRKDERREVRDEKKENDVRAGPAGVTVVTPPSSPTDAWLAEDFWRWAQSRRQEAELVAERFPNAVKLSGWYTTALHALQGDVDRLCEAFLAFGDDKYWQKQSPPLPFAGFMSQWERFVGVANAAP